MLITKEVEIGIQGSNAKWYEVKGYKILRIKNKYGRIAIVEGLKIIVKVEDLPKGSHVLISVKCDSCGELLPDMYWQNYKKYVHEDGKYYCNKCGSRIFGHIKHRETSIKNGKSFYQWCYDNLPKEKADIIIDRWSNTLNIDKNGNKLTPIDISHASAGFNKKGYWFNCLDHPEHKPEQKSINSLTGHKQRNIDCDQCNSIAVSHPFLINLLVDKEDAYKYSAGSKKKIPMKCPECGNEKELVIGNLLRAGFGCPRCSDGVSYSEKYIFNVIEQLKFNFQTQLSNTTFKWCNKFKYDFYIDIIDGIIIEAMGIQHYEKTNASWASLEETQDNDKIKEQLAKVNDIKNYIIIDCRKSDMDFIKNSIMTSELPQLLNFKEEDIDWLKCHEYACNSLVKVVCDMWVSGVNITAKIAEILKLDRSTIIRYLKQGAELGWCDYSSIDESKKNHDLLNSNKTVKVICLTTGEVFDSLKIAGEKYKIDSAGISSCCIGRIKSSGIHPRTGEKLVWMHYNKYIKDNI